MYIYTGSSTLLKYDIFSARGVWGRSVSSVNLGPPYISETIRDRKWKFYTRIGRPSALFGYDNFFARASQGAAPLV